jgi:hypothetical protein
LQPSISLKDAQPLIAGTYRAVYQHPQHDDLLIKVLRPHVAERFRRRRTWYNSRRRYDHYRPLLRELDEYLHLRATGRADLPFLQRFMGLVETDVGLGMVVGKVCGRDGALAPTLAALVARGGFSPELRALVAELRNDMIHHHVVATDISARNMVLADDVVHGHRLVIVDGLGDQFLIPVNSWSPAANRWTCERRFRRACLRMEELARNAPDLSPRSGKLA